MKPVYKKFQVVAIHSMKKLKPTGNRVNLHETITHGVVIVGRKTRSVITHFFINENVFSILVSNWTYKVLLANGKKLWLNDACISHNVSLTKEEQKDLLLVGIEADRKFRKKNNKACIDDRYYQAVLNI